MNSAPPATGSPNRLEPGSPAAERRALLLAGWTVLAWSTVASAFKIALRHGDVWTLVFFSSLTSALVLSLLAVLSGRRRELAAFEWADFLGLLNPAAYYLVLLSAYERLHAAQALAVNYTWVLALALLSVVFLRQPFSRRLAAGLLLGYAGIALVAAGRGPAPWSNADAAGLLLAFASTWIWAGCWVANARQESDPLAALARQFAVGAAVSGLAWAVLSRRLSAPALAGAAYLGVMEMGLSFFTWLSALRLTRQSARLGLLAFFSPVLSLVWIALVLEEPLPAATLGGMALILAGALLSRSASVR